MSGLQANMTLDAPSNRGWRDELPFPGLVLAGLAVGAWAVLAVGLGLIYEISDVVGGLLQAFN